MPDVSLIFFQSHSNVRLKLMSTYELGQLTGPLSDWDTFLPENLLDFARRAKCLAKLLDVGMPIAKEVYARACGYNGKLDLEASLISSKPSGPYDEAIPTDIYQEIPEARAAVQFYRNARLIQVIKDIKKTVPDRWFRVSDTIACDLGLFSTSHLHEIAKKKVFDFLDGQNSLTHDGFPFGYRGVMHAYYLYPINLDNASLQKALRENDLMGSPHQDLFDPREQSKMLFRHRAPQIFLSMIKETVSLGPDESEYVSIDLSSIAHSHYVFDETSWLLLNEDLEIGNALCGRYAPGASSDEIDRLIDSVRSPTPEVISNSSIAASIPNFLELIARTRLMLRCEIAKSIPDLDFEGYPQETRTLSNYGEIDGKYYWLSICSEKNTVYCSLQYRKLLGALFISETRDGPWSCVALLEGTHVVAADNNTYDDHASVIEFFEDRGDDALADAWWKLKQYYFPIAGYLTYHQWVNDVSDGGGVVSVIRPWVAPDHRGTDVSSLLLESFVGTFDDGMSHPDDYGWKLWLDPRTDDADRGDIEWETINGPGVVFLPIYGSGALGFSVWSGGEAFARLDLLNGVPLGRWDRFSKGAENNSGLAPSLLSKVKKIDADFLIYDPDHEIEQD